jgi:hypothetical protein
MTEGSRVKTRRMSILAGLIVIVAITITSPSIIGFCKWIASRQSSFRKDRIELPMMWSEETDESSQRRPSWVRPHGTLFNLFDDSVNVAPPYSPLKTPEDVVKWHQVYGVLSAGEAQSNDGFSMLASEGIECGKLRPSNAGNDQVAVGCISADRQTTLAYSGSLQELGAGLKIIGQALK